MCAFPWTTGKEGFVDEAQASGGMLFSQTVPETSAAIRKSRGGPNTGMKPRGASDSVETQVERLSWLQAAVPTIPPSVFSVPSAWNLFLFAV